MMRPDTPNAPRRLPETPSQTAGPYVHIGLDPAACGAELAARPLIGPRLEGAGRRIALSGTVLDGDGAPVTDALLELHQPDGDGRHDAPGWRGVARASADFATARFAFETVKPGPVGAGAPFATLLLFARGVNLHLHTRVYFPEDRVAIDADPALARLSPERRETLIAAEDGADVYRFDIVLQGARETVFFDI